MSYVQHLLSSYSKKITIFFPEIFSKLTRLEVGVYLRNLLIILILDGLVLDDEPLWEPLEWSVLQTWIIYIYIFAWAAEVIFSSRYGSYTNRDKTVWLGLFKVYFFMKVWFIGNIIFVTVFVTMPFYFEITYAISYSVVWWNWFTAVFFFKFTTILTVALLLSIIVKAQIRWLVHASTYLFLGLISILLLYLLYFSFITTLFSFFVDSSEYRNSGWTNLSRVIHGPLKWGWGLDSRDHFSYHRTPSVFWYKNDALIASSMLFLNLFLFKFLFFLCLQSLAVTRALYHSHELSFNMMTYFVSTLKQFMYFIFGLSSLLFLSMVYQFMRLPFELYWFTRLCFLGYLEAEVVFDFIKIIGNTLWFF